MQELLDSIIYSFQPTAQKIEQIKQLLADKVDYFCDFDDTIAHTNDILYTKLYVLKLLKRESKIPKLDFTLNEDFIRCIKSFQSPIHIVVLSRNNYEFLKMLTPSFKKLESYGIFVLAVIGKTKGFEFKSRQKLDFITNQILIADHYEHHSVVSSKNFVSVKPLSKHGKFWRIGYKVRESLKYFVKELFSR